MALSTRVAASFGVVDQVDVLYRFLRQPGSSQLAVGVTDPQTKQHAIPAVVVETLGAFQQQPADPIQGIAFSSPMALGLVLDPAPHLIEATVGDPHHVKGVGDAEGVSR